MSSPISVFIICKNEGRIIDACLQQASKVADEIVIVDSGSTDDTLSICRRYTDRVYHQDWLGFGPQKNLALSKCSRAWALSLDADEVLSDSLVDEIRALPLADHVEPFDSVPIRGGTEADLAIAGELPSAGYLLPRQLFIGDRHIRFGGFYPDYQLRLFPRSRGQFCSSLVHESVELRSADGYSKNRRGLERLCSPLLHHAYESVEQLEESFRKYAALSERAKSRSMAIGGAAYVFLYKYFLRMGIRDGRLGYRLALINAKYRYKKYIPGPEEVEAGAQLRKAA
ncbi:MAG: glycosyltransferase family 2 protein [Planctomycetota bacterium]